MNKFGRLFQISIFGESHGEGVGVLIDGVKPGISLSPSDFTSDLLRRKSGGLGTTPRLEDDLPCLSSGVFNGYTTGAPILISFKNNNVISKDYSGVLDTPRPGHADFTYNKKYAGFNDYRGGGASSGRLTLGLVSAGVVAKKLLRGVSLETKIINLNGEENPLKFNDILKATVASGDSVGGIVKIVARGVEIGLGEPYFDSLESTISHLLFSVGGVKGVEFGIGFNGVGLKGSEFNDPIINEAGKTSSNNNGGINGGISNGNDIEIKVFVKPTPSISKPQESYSFNTGAIKELELKGRHDAAIILRAMVVLEACVAIALADARLIYKAYKD